MRGACTQAVREELGHFRTLASVLGFLGRQRLSASFQMPGLWQASGCSGDAEGRERHT